MNHSNILQRDQPPLPQTSHHLTSTSSSHPTSRPKNNMSHPHPPDSPAPNRASASMSDLQSPPSTSHHSPHNPKKRSVSHLTPASSTNALVSSASRHSHSFPVPTPDNGRRKRKKTRIFEITGPTYVRKTNTGALGVSGRGIKLSSIPNVVYQMEKCAPKNPELELLHRLLFNSAGTMQKRKTNIRSFSGFVFQNEKQRTRVRDKLTRANLSMLRRIAALLDVPMREVKMADLVKNNRQPDTSPLAASASNMNGSAGPAQVANGHAPHQNGHPNLHTHKSALDEQGGMNATYADSSSQARYEAMLLERNKVERLELRHKREEAVKTTKERAVKDILRFLEMPGVTDGRSNLAQKEKEAKRQKKAVDREKAKILALKKAEEEKKLEAKRRAESEEDGDEDLETTARPWIVIAQERKERDERLAKHFLEGSDNDSDVITANGHG